MCSPLWIRRTSVTQRSSGSTSPARPRWSAASSRAPRGAPRRQGVPRPMPPQPRRPSPARPSLRRRPRRSSGPPATHSPTRRSRTRDCRWAPSVCHAAATPPPTSGGRWAPPARSPQEGHEHRWRRLGRPLHGRRSLGKRCRPPRRATAGAHEKAGLMRRSGVAPPLEGPPPRAPGPRHRRPGAPRRDRSPSRRCVRPRLAAPLQRRDQMPAKGPRQKRAFSCHGRRHTRRLTPAG